MEPVLCFLLFVGEVEVLNACWVGVKSTSCLARNKLQHVPAANNPKPSRSACFPQPEP